MPQITDKDIRNTFKGKMMDILYMAGIIVCVIMMAMAHKI